MGSSNYITNLLGEVSQHMEYFAFGETFVEEHNGSNNSPYKFNDYGGKSFEKAFDEHTARSAELDEETGYYYYGARYYDPRVSLWLSVDPLAVYNPVQETEFYLDGQHNGGIFNDFNQGVYNYCYQNPVLYVDPNGKQVKWDKLWDGLLERASGSRTGGLTNGWNTGGVGALSPEGAHTTLDAMGLVPVLGEAFDGINAAWYALEGDYTNAGLSAASTLPIAGYGAVGTKWLMKGLKLSETSAKLIKSVGKGNKELIIKTTSNTYADAKKIAQEITGVGDDAADYVTTVKGSPLNGKVTGKTKGKNYWRLDIDKNTGQAHINYSVGKGKKGRIDFGGGERNVKSIVDNVLNE